MKKYYMNAEEVAKVLEISVANAYTRIREMNNELSAGGYQIVSGKIPIAYFKKKYYGLEEEVINSGISEINT